MLRMTSKSSFTQFRANSQFPTPPICEQEIKETCYEHQASIANVMPEAKKIQR